MAQQVLQLLPLERIDLLRRQPNPADADIATLTNLCRCGTYPRIRSAIRRAAELMRTEAAT